VMQLRQLVDEAAPWDEAIAYARELA
jgi:hypothetical protein